MFRAIFLSGVLVASVAIGNDVPAADACSVGIGARKAPRTKRHLASKNPSRILIVGTKDIELVKRLRGARHRTEYASTVARAKRDGYDLIIAGDTSVLIEARKRFPNSTFLKKKSSQRKTTSVVELMLARRAGMSSSRKTRRTATQSVGTFVDRGFEGVRQRSVKASGYEYPSISRQAEVASSTAKPSSSSRSEKVDSAKADSAIAPQKADGHKSTKQTQNKEQLESKGRNWNHSITFGNNKTKLNSSQMRRLRTNALRLRENQSSRITIEGHSDSVGDEAYNMDLSERRANMARDFLVSFGISVDRITVKAKGELEPAFQPSTSGRNRRIVMIKK